VLCVLGAIIGMQMLVTLEVTANTSIVGTGFLGIPMSAFGVAFIGNIWALSMFGNGLRTRGYSTC